MLDERNRTDVAARVVVSSPLLHMDDALVRARCLSNAICSADDLLVRDSAWESALMQLRELANAPGAVVETRELLATALQSVHDALPSGCDDARSELRDELRALATQNRTSEVIAAQYAKALHAQITWALGEERDCDIEEAIGLLEEMRGAFGAGALPLSDDSEHAYASSVYAVFDSTGEPSLLNELRNLTTGGPPVRDMVLLGLALTRPRGKWDLEVRAELQALFSAMQEQADYELELQTPPDSAERLCLLSPGYRPSTPLEIERWAVAAAARANAALNGTRRSARSARVRAFRWHGSEILELWITDELGNAHRMSFTAGDPHDFHLEEPSVPDLVEALHMAGIVIRMLGARVDVGELDGFERRASEALRILRRPRT